MSTRCDTTNIRNRLEASAKSGSYNARNFVDVPAHELRALLTELDTYRAQAAAPRTMIPQPDPTSDDGWPAPLNIPDTLETRARFRRNLEHLTGGAVSMYGDDETHPAPTPQRTDAGEVGDNGLLPCPFCGGPAFDDFDDPDGAGHIVGCDNRACPINPEKFMDHEGPDHDVRVGLRAAWNRRDANAHPDPTPQRTDAGGVAATGRLEQAKAAMQDINRQIDALGVQHGIAFRELFLSFKEQARTEQEALAHSAPPATATYPSVAAAPTGVDEGMRERVKQAISAYLSLAMVVPANFLEAMTDAVVTAAHEIGGRKP